MALLIGILGGFVLGSISPSYLLGRLLRGIDIREKGTKNAGTLNTYRVLGLGPAIVVAAYDLAKGLLAMFLCRLAGGSALAMHLAGAAAVAGHVFPFYLRFRGGQGVATATAMLIYYLVNFYVQGWLPPLSLLLLAVAVGSFAYIARRGEVVGLVVLPFIAIFGSFFSPPGEGLVFLLSVIVYILAINVINIQKHGLMPRVSSKDLDIIGWRLYLRPLAFILVIFYLLVGKKQALILIGSLSAFFLLPDVLRLASSKINLFFFHRIKKVYRDKERKKFSSITIFLFAMFLTISIFERGIAALAVSFLIFGDFFSKVFGLLFGRHRLFSKTLEGSLAHLNACLVSGYLMANFLSLPLSVFLVGAFAASLAELLPLGVDDNFSVALLSASAMSIFGVGPS